MTMNIGLIAVDSNYPNLALMKLSAWHKSRGDAVEWYNPLSHYDKVYMAKVFGFTPDYGYYIHADEVEKGGTGYDLHKTLPEEIDRLQPDYSIYPQIDKKTAYGFLTRGCPNRCRWCIVPEKEGKIAPYMDVEEIAVDWRTNLILMDKNVLASGYGLAQIEKIIRKGYHVDFNQGLEPRVMVAGYEVDPNTVGQFTGLHDSDGKEIYEGDIFQVKAYEPKFEVYFKNGVFEYRQIGIQNRPYPLRRINFDSFVIGNIYDNPELLEEVNDRSNNSHSRQPILWMGVD